MTLGGGERKKSRPTSRGYNVLTLVYALALFQARICPSYIARTPFLHDSTADITYTHTKQTVCLYRKPVYIAHRQT